MKEFLPHRKHYSSMTEISSLRLLREIIMFILIIFEIHKFFGYEME
jgi:hypothetical protein